MPVQPEPSIQGSLNKTGYLGRPGNKTIGDPFGSMHRVQSAPNRLNNEFNNHMGPLLGGPNTPCRTNKEGDLPVYRADEPPKHSVADIPLFTLGGAKKHGNLVLKQEVIKDEMKTGPDIKTDVNKHSDSNPIYTAEVKKEETLLDMPMFF